MSRREWVVGETALADGADGGILGRFDTHDEAARYIDTLDPVKRDRGDYYIDGPCEDADEADPNRTHEPPETRA